MKIWRRRWSIGADCMDCGWVDYDGDRKSARDHAQQNGHTVHYVVEETTVYKAKSD